MNAFPKNVHEKILKCFWSQNISQLSPLKIGYFRDVRIEIGVSLNILNVSNFDTIDASIFQLLHSNTKYIDFVRIFFTAFYLLKGKYHIAEKFGISLRPEAHIRTITTLFKWHLSTFKTDYNSLIRFLLKNVLSYYSKLNQGFKQPFASGGIEASNPCDQVALSWSELDFKIKITGLIKEEIVSLSVRVKTFQAKQIKKTEVF